MKNKTDPVIETTLKELKNFPPLLLEQFERVVEHMPESLSDQQFEIWAKTGIEIAGQTVRSWESAIQFYRVSPSVLNYIPFNYFQKWAKAGVSLAEKSPTLATSYFESSPATISKLRSRHLESWATLGGSLYRGTWKSSTLASKFSGLECLQR